MDPFRPQRPARRPSTRFLPQEQVVPRQPLGLQFAEGAWPAIRVQLEGEGWSFFQVEWLHDQLRQGWPLAQAKRHVAQLSGSCPVRRAIEP